MDKKALQIAFAAALVILAASRTSAQTSTATLSGIVRDQQQAVAPSAEVVVTQVETGLKRKSTSSATGDYTITNLGLGTYTLTISANGFRPSAFQGIRLDVGQQARVDVVLALSGRNILTADGLKQLDMTLAKQFPITESKRIDLRAEIFNLTNTPTFNSPSSTIDSATGGKVTSTLNAARILQFALKFYF